jgi:hypothetical protein
VATRLSCLPSAKQNAVQVADVMHRRQTTPG